jgi:hypothetical protein
VLQNAARDHMLQAGALHSTSILALALSIVLTVLPLLPSCAVLGGHGGGLFEAGG